VEIREINIDGLCDACRENLSEISDSWLELKMMLDKECYVEDDFLVFNVSGSSYEIGLDMLDTPQNILNWACHLSEKTWMRKDLLRYFMEIASSQIDYDVHTI